MPADVNVTEKVARALFEHRLATGDFVDGPTAWDDLPEPWRDEWHEGAAAALAALADPEVQAGIAGVLRAHGDSRASAGGFLLVCRCGDAVDDHAAHQTAAVVEWLRGRAL